MGTGRKVRQAQAGAATGGKVGQVQQVGAKGRKMHHGTNIAGVAKGRRVGHVAGVAGGYGQWWESEHFVAIAHRDIAHCGFGTARARW